MTKFADQLFDDLMHEHGSALAHLSPPAPVKRHVTARRTVLAAGGAGLAAAAAVTGFVVTNSGGAPAHVPGSTSPAYALTKNPDGTITLAVYSKAGIAEANARLRLLGDKNVVLVPAEAGCPGIHTLPKPAVPAHIQARTATSVRRGQGGGTVTVDAHGIPAQDVLVIAMESTAHGTLGASVLTSPPAPGCVSLPAPPPGPGGSGAGSGS